MGNAKCECKSGVYASNLWMPKSTLYHIHQLIHMELELQFNWHINYHAIRINMIYNRFFGHRFVNGVGTTAVHINIACS
jgi:hypothetical protein